MVSERNHQALQRAQEAGVTVVLVTGRPPRTMRPIAERAGVTGLAICSNGAVIYDLGDDAIVDHWPLEPAVVAQLVVRLREAAPGVFFALEYGLRSGREPGYPMPRRPNPLQEVLIDDIFVLARETAVKLIAHHPGMPTETLLEVAQTVVGNTALATYSGVGFIEISAAGIHKAWALERLCARLGIRAEEVVAFGDMPNDLEMLAWAGRGVAVANAHPTVLQHAREIAPSNMEDGVA
ncbi:MAG TPA: HAD family hydrolase, partial [Ktedonobacterales bacterium]|nr:HAD family hydrolase [Ktedonobacterales bacterium]